MKRTVKALGALVLGMALLPMTAAAESIDVWMINNPVASIIKAFDDAAADFEATSGIKINYVRIPTNDFHTKLVTSVAAKQYPDLIIWNSMPGIEFGATGAVEYADDVVNSIGRNQFNPTTLQTFTVGGKLHEIPFLVRPAGLHMRKDWLEKAGYDTTLLKDSKGYYFIKGLQTWEDILAAAKKMTNTAENKYGMGVQFSRKGFGDSASFAFSILGAYGAPLVDKNGKVVINSPQAVEAFTFIKKVWDAGVNPQAALTWDGNGNNQYFLHGDVGAVYNSNSILAKLGIDANIPNDKVVMVPFPAGPRGDSVLSAGAETITLFKTAKLGLSKQYAKYLMATPTQIKMFKTMGFGYYGPLKAEVMDNDMFDTLTPNEKVLLQDGRKAGYTPYPAEFSAKMTALYSSFFYDDALSRIAVDKWTPQQVVAEMEKKVKAALDD